MYMMRLKLIIIMLLAIGIVACTKGDTEDDILKCASDNAIITNMSIGEFEGEWVFDEQVLDTAKLTVTRQSFEVRLPVEALLKKYGLIVTSIDYGNPNNPSNNPNTDGSYDVKYKYEPYRVTWNYVNHGYSTATNYVYFSENNFSDENIVNFVLGYFYVNNKINGLGYEYEVCYSRDQPGVAMFDTFTYLWTLKIGVKITITYLFDGKVVEGALPTDLVYIAKKKIN